MMQHLIKKISEVELSERRAIPITVVQESGIRLKLNEVSVFESEIKYIVISEDGFCYPAPLHSDDPFSGVMPNGWMLLKDGQWYNIVSPMKVFVDLGWRPVEWWYYAQFDNRVAGGAGDDFEMNEESITRELKEYEGAKQFMIKQEEDPWIIKFSKEKSEGVSEKVDLHTDTE
jgi:hypothetical protein